MKKVVPLIAAIIVAPSCGMAQGMPIYDDFVKPTDLFRENRVYYIPPQTRKGSDFKNQVLLNLNVRLRISQTRNQLEAMITMVAQENRADWTSAAGSTDWIPVEQAKSRTGWTIISPRTPAASYLACQASILSAII